MPFKAPFKATIVRCALVASASLVALGLGVSAPYAATDEAPAIERVWSFSGGAVAIQAQPDGTFTGTVVEPTKFAECSHPVEQAMWTDIRLQPSGEYVGNHIWYFVGQHCQKTNPTPGPTAWRVLTSSTGKSYLLVCFSPPGGPQPTIAPTGATENVGYRCFSSAELARVSPAATEVESFTQALSSSLSSKKACVSLRNFPIHLRQPKYDPFKSLAVMLDSHQLAVKRHGRAFTATVNLSGLPAGAFTVEIRATTVLGHHLVGSRTYHTCALEPKSSKPQPLKAAHRR